MNKPYVPTQQGSLQDKLMKMREQTKDFHFRKPIVSNLPPVDSIGEDGVDHINISDRGTTELGVALNHKADLPFKHSVYDKFRTMEGFWYYIRSVSRDDRTRTMDGHKVNKFGSLLPCQRVDNFKYIILDANWQKIKSYPPLMEEIGKITLPFDSYRYHNNIRIRSTSSYWIIDGFEEIRRAIVEKREPDFTFLKDPVNTFKKTNASPKEVITRPKPAVLSSKFTSFTKPEVNEVNIVSEETTDSEVRKED